ncbi:hypothetical protein BN12_40060 [Nostocoides japonicum T1-X7]|uniref:Uncharacterized protein n=1 Tax=Nostocoides japonicum T1-X7 TaxID=1194083 RepID=A0A077M4P5_9MICO|nr:hypothetical protein [Tetrasphaera japonica]CCH79090.1 hypothetical protein BN12_40060 [Tetrasphaera japonica T1-X7]
MKTATQVWALFGPFLGVLVGGWLANHGNRQLAREARAVKQGDALQSSIIAFVDQWFVAYRERARLTHQLTDTPLGQPWTEEQKAFGEVVNDQTGVLTAIFRRCQLLGATPEHVDLMRRACQTLWASTVEEFYVLDVGRALRSIDDLVSAVTRA